jgi:hypothetical protein
MKPTNGTVEELREQVTKLAASSPRFELWVPASLTMGGKAIPRELGMALVVDAVLGAGFEPDGVPVTEADGSMCTYRRE